MSANTWEIGSEPVLINEGYGDKSLLIINTGPDIAYLSDTSSPSGFPLKMNAVLSWPAAESLYVSSAGASSLTVMRTNAVYFV